MAPSTLEQQKVVGSEDADLALYEAINPWAIVALILGVISLGVLFLSWLLPVAIFAVAAGVVALYQMSDETAGQSGRWMAVTGLVLALFCSGTALGREAMRVSLLRSEAREVAEAWLRLIKEGDLPAAHQMTVAHRSRQAAETNLKEFYAAGSRQEELTNYFKSSPMDKILKHAKEGEFFYEQENTVARNENDDYVDQLYRLEWKDASGIVQSFPFRIVLERSPHPTLGYGRWRISAVAPPVDK